MYTMTQPRHKTITAMCYGRTWRKLVSTCHNTFLYTKYKKVDVEIENSRVGLIFLGVGFEFIFRYFLIIVAKKRVP